MNNNEAQRNFENMVKQQNLQQQLDLDKIEENSDDEHDQTLA